MRPLSSVFGLNLQTAVKIVCKSFLFLVTLTLMLNLLNLDYEGPRQESTISLGVVLLFLTLLTGSAFTGHSGADREGLGLVVTSLCLLTLAVSHWLIVGIISMQKGDPTAIWRVCLQNRCAETLWTLDLEYRITHPALTNKTATLMRQTPLQWSTLNTVTKSGIERKKIYLSLNLTGLASQEMHKKYNKTRGLRVIRTYTEDYEEQEVEFGERSLGVSQTLRPIEFWKRFTNTDYASSDPSSTVSLLVTLLCFLLFFVYFCGCVLIICSYSSELYDEYRLGDFFEEEEEKNTFY